MTDNRSIAFFDEQLRRQPMGVALKLNPFEEPALPYLRGDMLDFGCGLGNLAFAAAAPGGTLKRFCTLIARKPTVRA